MHVLFPSTQLLFLSQTTGGELDHGHSITSCELFNNSYFYRIVVLSRCCLIGVEQVCGYDFLR